jgi:hypothetical protein
MPDSIVLSSGSGSEYDSDDDSECSEDPINIPVRDLAKRFDLPTKNIERVRNIFMEHDDDHSGGHPHGVTVSHGSMAAW